MIFARMSQRAWRAVPRSASPRGGAVPPSWRRCWRPGLPGVGREYGDLGLPGDGLLGRGGVPEFRAGFLGALRVALAAWDVECVQRCPRGGVRRCGERS
jgi:hypothetical protein